MTLSRVKPVEVESLLSHLAAAVASVSPEAVAGATELILRTWRHDGTVLVFGNGGSASTASHVACDFTKNTRRPGVRALRCLALGENVALLTAVANDVAYERVFADQLEALGRAGDLALAISVSGTSPNVVVAAESARRLGLPLLALTGSGGGRLKDFADVLIEVDSVDFGCVETAHLAVEHVLVHRLGAAMRKESGGNR